MSEFKLVLIRHGESLWNKENRFTGWVDVDLSPKGFEEAKAAGVLLKKEGLQFDMAYTSVLKRAIRTLWTVLDELDLMWLPVTKDWRLNERHYGGLQGLNKAETANKFGEEQVQIWRRSYDVPPPELSEEDLQKQMKNPRYAHLPLRLQPKAEALKQTKERLLPLWNEEIADRVRAGKNVLIVAHGNSIRALIQHLDGLSKEEIMGLNIPTGIPLVYTLNEDLKPIGKAFLGDPETVAKAQAAVANQGKK